jgi:hypothetical protein
MHVPPARPLRFQLTTGSQTLITGAGILSGWSLIESTGAAASTLSVYDGAISDATALGFVSLTQGQSTRDLFTPPGIQFDQGLIVSATVGATKGVIYAVPGEVFDQWLITQGYAPYYAGNY